MATEQKSQPQEDDILKRIVSLACAGKRQAAANVVHLADFAKRQQPLKNTGK